MVGVVVVVVVPEKARARARARLDWTGLRRLDSLAHAEHPINLLDSQPVKDVRHECLESHVLDTGNVLGSPEIVRRAIFAALSGVVHHCDVVCQLLLLLVVLLLTTITSRPPHSTRFCRRVAAGPGRMYVRTVLFVCY